MRSFYKTLKGRYEKHEITAEPPRKPSAPKARLVPEGPSKTRRGRSHAIEDNIVAMLPEVPDGQHDTQFKG